MSAKFQSIINSKRPVLVDFYTDWCGPCKQIPPVLKEVKEEFRENLKIIKVNVDKNPAIATKYQIHNLPTLIVFKEGDVQWKGVGVRLAGELKSIISQYVTA